jgi:DNA gyrase/topoisomerase IV subunit B
MTVKMSADAAGGDTGQAAIIRVVFEEIENAMDDALASERHKVN